MFTIQSATTTVNGHKYPSALVIDHVESETICSQELHTSVVLDGEKYNIGGFYKFPTGGDIYSITALLAWGSC